MRDLVRTQLDLDDTDLPNMLLDAYIQEGYDRAIELEQRWPFFAFEWSIPFGADGVGQMPPDARVIELLVGASGELLKRIPMRMAVMSFPPGNSPTSGSPTYWAPLNRKLSVFPAPGDTYATQAIGFRLGADWINDIVVGGASGECDCDRRLHIPICWYACSLGYAQQEDEVLEATYLNRFRESTTMARDAIMKPWTGAPRQVFYMHYPPAPSSPGGPAQLTFELPGP